MRSRLITIYILAVPVLIVGFELLLAQAGVGQTRQLSATYDTLSYRQELDPSETAAMGGDGQESAWNIDFISQLDTPISTVAVRGAYAYVGAGRWLVVLDVSDPTNMPVVSRTEVATSSGIQDIHLAGDYAYVTAAGLRTIDISDPTAPIQVGTYDTPGQIYVAGNFAYAAVAGQWDSICSCYVHSLRVVDISDPTTPVEVGYEEYETQGAALGIQVAGDYAYVVWQYCYSTGGYPPYDTVVCRGGLLVFDVSNSATPVKVGTLAIPVGINDMYVTRDYVFVAAEDSLRVIDVSDPTAPVEVGLAAEDASDIYVAGSYAYLLNSGGLTVVDISNPTAPFKTGSYRIPGTPREIYVAGSHAYLATYQYTWEHGGKTGLWVLDLSNPRRPVEVGTYTPLDDASSVHVVGSYAYVAAPSAGIDLFVVDVSAPAAPIELGTYEVPGHVSDIYVTNGYVYLLWQRNDRVRAFGLRVVDISNPTAPVNVGTYDMDVDSRDTPGPGLDFYVAGDYAYIAGYDGLWVVDVSDPRAPTLAGVSITQFTDYHAIHVSGDYAYVAASELSRPEELRVIDVSDPTAPVEVGTYGKGWRISDVYVANNYAYVATYEGLLVVDISDPTMPVRVSTYDFSPKDSSYFRASDVYVAGNYAYILWERDDHATRRRGLQVIDISDPTAPKGIGYRILPARISPESTDVYVAGPYTYVAAGAEGLITLKYKYAPIPPTTTLIPTTGGSFSSQPDRTTYSFAAGTFDGTVAVTHTPLLPSEVATTGALVDLGHIFEAGAVYSDTGQPAQPTRPYTITVGYTDVERGTDVEGTLALYGWDGEQWAKEPTSRLAAESNAVTATPDHFGLWAVLGETQRMFLPLLATRYDSQRPITRLTVHPTRDLQPALAPDGRLAFISSRSGWPPQVHVRPLVGEVQRVHLPNSVEGHRPIFMADGRLTVAARYSDTGWDVIIYDDGEISFPLGQPPGDESHPAISPDGRFLAYATEAPGNRTIHVVDLETKEALISIPTEGWDGPPDMGAGLPAWSPDSREIVFRGDDRQINADIFVLNIETGNLRQLTDGAAFDTWPSFPPDGQWILFETNRAGSDDIFVMNREGSQITPVIAWPTIEQTPAWSTDGKYILFSSNADGDSDIYRVPFVPPANSRAAPNQGARGSR